MSTRHLLPCTACGKSVPVSPSQAGGAVTCECGARLDVPRLGEMRNLPADESVPPQAAAWSFRNGVLSAGLLIAGALAAGAGWFAAVEPAPPAPPDAAARTESVQRQLDAMPPAQLFQLYTEIYKPLIDRGFQEFKSPEDVATLRRIDQCRLYRNVLVGAAGAVVVATLVLVGVAPK
ncbi:hypothetical protein [Botrimarina mediterranea]|uniref:Uncharacterized protein n=1 Tax=Botrimarina mediterranea TaxID=2528022 RepID=A0A518KE54_9BACT|nr:hypothetical protein [Botrimarina mediterranea]QDV76065.1 hypothetical protein Spa11_42890 [Botrimarina mediterranea]QDV80660.1 hypothetical protein K2D_42900 [Planctomycetes bacterium K2D]